jgi:hypothetical protein
MGRGLACLAGFVVASTAWAGPPPWTIRASATFQRLGAWQIQADATYSDALVGLGPADACRLRAGDPTRARATWAAIGVHVELRTYASIPPGKTGCTAPRSIYVHTVRVVDARWQTSFGLRTGDGVARLRRLYPSAARHAGVEGWYGAGYWLVTRRSACLGDCTTAMVTVPRLVAETAGGRVVAFRFVVGAEGE